MIHFRVRYERVQARLVSQLRRTTLLRAGWVALLPWVAAAGAGVAGVRVPAWSWIAGGAVLFVAGLVWQRRAGAPPDPGRWLDRRFALDDLMVTAIEVDRRGARSALEARLLDDAATTVAQLGGERVVGGRRARREAETLAAVVLGLGGLSLLAGTVRAPAVPPAMPPLDVGAGGAGTGSSAGGSGDGASEATGRGATADMRLLADALGDHAAARPVADALARGDPWSAARAARALGDRAAAMSAGGRRDLAAALHAAADAAGAPDLSESLREAGRALESPDPEVAAAAVDRLATHLGSAPRADAAGGSGSFAPVARSRQGPAAPRLAAAADAASLGAGRAGTSAGGAARTPRPTGRTVAGESVPAPDAPASAVTPGGLDVLACPSGLRATVRRYFSRHSAAP